MQHPPKKVKIGLMGPFGFGNLGDAAIQDAMIQHIKIYFPDADIYGFSLNPEDTAKRHGIKSFPVSWMNWLDDTGSKTTILDRLTDRLNLSDNSKLNTLKRWAARLPREFSLIKKGYQNLSGFDYLIVSGGGQLDDYWCGGGPWSYPYTLLKWGIIAKFRKTKYLFVSVGAGPIDAPLSQRFIKWALSLASYRSFRDEYSKEFMRNLGYQKDDPVFPDLAHSISINKIPLQGARTSNPIIGIGPIGYFRQECWPEHNEEIYSTYLDKLTSLIEWLLQKQYNIMFLPGEVYYDQLAIGDLIDRLNIKDKPNLETQILRPKIETVNELLGQLSIPDIVVVSRFHNILLAQLLGKPVLALSYQDKIESLMADTEQSDYCFRIDRFDVEVLKERIKTIEGNCETIKVQVQRQSNRYKNALAEQYEHIFTQV